MNLETEEKIRLLSLKKQQCLKTVKELESEIKELEGFDKDLIHAGNCYQSKNDSQIRVLVTKCEKDSKIIEYVIVKECLNLMNSIISIEYRQVVKDMFAVENYKQISKEEFEVLYNNTKNNINHALSPLVTARRNHLID